MCPGESVEDIYRGYSQAQPATEPGTRVALTAVFLDPSFRKVMLEWCVPFYSLYLLCMLVRRSLSFLYSLAPGKICMHGGWQSRLVL